MSLPKPYYQDSLVTIYNCDCKDIITELSGIDLVLTDPPYGINYVHGNEPNNPHASKFCGVPVIGDDKPFDPTFLLSFENICLWGANHYASKLPDSKGWLVWDKRCMTTVNDQSDCELAWTNKLTTARLFYHVWNGFMMGSEKGIKRVHPTQKPVALMAWCMGFFPDTKLVLDPYLGSGTTAVAAKKIGKKCIGVEISEQYCEIAVKRLAQSVMDLGI